jgi:hypothetical protein
VRYRPVVITTDPTVTGDTLVEHRKNIGNGNESRHPAGQAAWANAG